MIRLAAIEREMRALSRAPLTYNLRVLGVLAFAAVLGTLWFSTGGHEGLGGYLFLQFHRILFFGIWILVPLMTADCISRERREGTLPLLFLTPMTQYEVVCAKGLVHGLRSLTLWLAVLPVFTICFLAGGVGWLEVVISAMANLSAICLALAAGVLASSKARIWNRALILSALLACLALAGFLCLLLFTLFVSHSTQRLTARLPVDEGDALLAIGLAIALDYQDFWQQTPAFVASGPNPLLICFGLVALLSAGALFLALRLSAWYVSRDWRKEPSAFAVLMKQKLLSPVLFRRQLRGWLNWQLERNPVGWLEQRSWSSRLVIWSWLAIVGCVYSSLFSNVGLYQRSFHFLQSVLAILLCGSMAVSAAGSFRRERETGVLELLLVAPMREWQIITGRVCGIWMQFLPAIILLLGVWLFAATFLASENEVPFVVFHAINFATLPVVGLYFSLSKSNFISALVWTLLVQLVFPQVCVVLCETFLQYEIGLAGVFAQGVIQCIVAAWLGWRLWVKLKTRAFRNGALMVS